MDEEDTRTIRRLTNENAALRDANQALSERLARYEQESTPHEAPLPGVHDELLTLAYEELERERGLRGADLEEMSQIWQNALDENNRGWQETCDQIELTWRKSFDDTEHHWILNYHRARGQIISMAIYFVVLAYGIAVLCTYLGATKGLEAALMGRQLQFSFALPSPIFLIVLIGFIGWRIWHWRRTPPVKEKD